MTLLHAGSSWTVLAPGLVVAGLGWGAINPAAAEGALAVVPPTAAAMASGIVQVTRQIGIAVGIAALGAIFHARVDHALSGARALADGVAGGATHDLAARMPAPAAHALQAAAQNGLADGIRAIALVGAAICALGALTVIAIAVAARRHAPEPQPATA
jgi:hypothetical protein